MAKSNAKNLSGKGSSQKRWTAAESLLLAHSVIEIAAACWWFWDSEAMLPQPVKKIPDECDDGKIKPAQVVAVRSFALAILCLGWLSWRALRSGDKQLQRFVMQILPVYHLLFALMIVYNGHHPDVHYPVIGPLSLLPEPWKEWLRSEFGLWVSWWEHHIKMWLGFALHFGMAAGMLWLSKDRAAASRHIKSA